MIPIRLSALSAGAAPTTANGPAAKIFPGNRFIEMKVYRVVDDHVVAMHDGVLCAYAIGHLPAHVRQMLMPTAAVGAALAGTATRTILGMVADKVIEDLRDDDPMACPVAIAAIRRYARDPGRTLRDYAGQAGILGETLGRETSPDGEAMFYHGHERRLTIEMTTRGWKIERDAITVRQHLPDTICAAAPGRPLSQLVEHPMLEGVDARVVDAESRGDATRIAYETKPVRILGLPEMDGEGT